jgi:DUF1365 family protein
MISRVYRGSVWHRREKPKVHQFSYPAITFGFDLEELGKRKWPRALLGYNSAAVFSIYDRDYIANRSGTLQQKLNAVIAENLQLPAPAESILFTMPRCFGYIFNPVSFFVSRNDDRTIHSVVVEVHNTFGETHLYPQKPQSADCSLPISFRCHKSFFVSPFFDVDGEYTLTLHSVEEKLHITLDLAKVSERVFSAALTGNGSLISSSSLLKTLGRFPLTLWLTMPRIHVQAVALYRRAQVGIFRKPVPTDPATIHSNQNFLHRLRLTVLRFLER